MSSQQVVQGMFAFQPNNEKEDSKEEEDDEDDEDDDEEETIYADQLAVAHVAAFLVPDATDAVTPPLNPVVDEASCYPCFADLYKGVCVPSVVSKSVENSFKAVWKHWDTYCKENGRRLCASSGGTASSRDTGLGLFEKCESQFTNSAKPDENSYETSVVGSFFSHLPTLDLMKKAKTFINAHLKAEYYCRLKKAGYHSPTVPTNISVGKLVEVSGCCKAAAKRNAVQARDNFQDFQAEVDNSISAPKIRELAELALNSDTTEVLDKMSDIMKLNFIASFFSSQQICRRGEDHYKQKLVQRFTRVIKRIGPKPGTMCSFVVMNEAKHNQVNRLEYTAQAPHSDALRDAAAWHGILWLHRLCVSSEPLPDFFDYKELFKVATYRAAHTAENMGPKYFGQIWKEFYVAAKIIVRKKTHQWKGQGQREMHDSGCLTEDISRFVGQQAATTKSTNAQTLSYLTNPPVSCVVERAGGDPLQPKLHAPAWSLPLVEESMLREISQLSKLLDHRDAVHLAYDACQSHHERMENRLCTAKGSIDSMVHDITRAFQLFASRPLDPETLVLQQDKPTMQENERFRQGTLKPLFDLPVFAGARYQDLQQRVRKSEDNCAGLTLLLTHPVRNELHKVIQEQIAGPINTIGMVLQQVLQELGQQRSSPHAMTVHEHFPRDASILATSHCQPLALPPPPSEDTLKGTNRPRKKRRGLNQRLVLQAETATDSQCPRPVLSGSDSGCVTVYAYWDLYKSRWKPLEDKWGAEWRVDKPFATTANSQTQKGHARSTWWGTRRPMYDFINHHLASGRTEDEALSLANDVFASAVQARGGSPCLKQVSRAFISKLAEIGPRPKGRPKGSTKKRQKQANASENAFGMAFAGAEFGVDALEAAHRSRMPGREV